MRVLLLNAGSSSLKATLMETADEPVVARGLADWAGAVNRFEYAGSDGKRREEAGRDMARRGSPSRILVIAASEDLTMLREVVHALEAE